MYNYHFTFYKKLIQYCKINYISIKKKKLKVDLIPSTMSVKKKKNREDCFKKNLCTNLMII